MRDRMIPLTGDRGQALVPVDDLTEPRRGSIVLTDGIYGTAYQRLFSDGLWHSSTGNAGNSWDWMLKQRNLVLVYDAHERPVSEPMWPRPGRRANLPLGA